MRFELIDSLTLPGNPAKPNEDAFGHSANAALVMDGATGVGDSLMPGASDAAWLAQFGARRILSHLGESDAPVQAVRAALADAEKSFKALRRRAPKETYEIPFASMMLVTAKAAGFEALSFGDCAALVKRPGAQIEILGIAFQNRTREAAGAARLAKAKGLNPAARTNLPQFLDALRKERNSVNTGKGHWLFGPDVTAADHVAIKPVGAPAGTLVLLSTDGFLALASDYGRYDAEGLMAAAQTKGLKALGEEVRAVEAGDPEGVAYPRFKTSDDATALLLRLA
jgi:Protein phosphatase 2C